MDKARSGTGPERKGGIFVGVGVGVIVGVSVGTGEGVLVNVGGRVGVSVGVLVGTGDFVGGNTAAVGEGGAFDSQPAINNGSRTMRAMIERTEIPAKK